MSRTASYRVGGFLAAYLALSGTARAFPFVDPSNEDSLPTGAPTGTELPTPDITGLQNQLRLTNPAAPGNPGTWTIIPRLSMQELITDNVLQVTSPRRGDAITAIGPGINVAADTARLQMHLDYSPNLLLHAIDGPLNVLTQQLNLTGLFTVAPNLAFVDFRALSGVQSRFGALAATGTIGNGNGALAPASTTAVTPQGTNPQTEVQTSSVGLSPYLLRQFKDYGTGKLGVSIDASHYSTITGFAADPLPTGGNANGQSLLTTEQYGSFTTGEFLGKVQNAVSFDLYQSRSQYGGGEALVFTPQGTTTTTNLPATNFTSQRETINDQLTYALNRTIALLGSIGQQHIEYSNGAAQPVNGPTWSVGAIITPNPYSSLKITYGHLNGANSVQADGYMALGGRSQISFDYSNTLGTQLENLQNQLNNSVLTQGGLVNAQTGGANFVGTNALGVATGVYRFQTLNTAFATTWQRDTLQANATWSIQTNLTPGNVQTAEVENLETGQIEILNVPIAGTGQSTDVKTVALSWTHDLTPDMTFSASSSYTFLRRSAGLGNDGSLATALGLQYVLSASTILSARYSFFDRVSKIPGYSLYDNILILGFTKQF